MKDHKEINKETYNVIVRDWNKRRAYPWKPVASFLKNIKNNKKILDLGCGTGRHLELAKKLGFDNIVGCDFSEKQLEITKKKGFKTKLCQLTDLDFEDNSFDIVLLIATHHHLLERDDQLKSLKEVKRILKKEGKVLLCNWKPSDKYLKTQKKSKFKFLDDKKKKVKVTYTIHKEKYDRYYYIFSESELASLCKKAGFKILRQEVIKDNIYMVLT